MVIIAGMGVKQAMLIRVLHSKIHRATVTDADLHYEGSLTLDRHLMELADLLPYQQIHIYNVTTGARFETYVIEGPVHSGVVQVNGAAAHLAKKGDIVIIASYADMEREAAKSWRPRLVYVDSQNRPRRATLRSVAGRR